MLIKKRLSRSIVIAICFCLLCSTILNTFSTNSIAEEYKPLEFSPVTENYAHIENGNLDFKIDKNNGKFTLLDKRSHMSWFSNPQNTENDKISVGLTKTNIESQIVLEYLSSKDENTRTTTQITNSYTMCVNGGSINVEESKNKIRVTYNFKDIDIVIPVLYSLNESGYLEATIDLENIKENGEYLIVTIQFLPFFAAANSTQQGYLFIPDGCGAIAQFNQNIIPYKPYEKMIYGDDTVHKVGTDTSNDLGIRMPVFGTVFDDTTALMGVITEGDGSASILAQTGNSKTYYNTVFSKLIYRIYSEEQALYTNNKNKTISTLTHTDFGLKKYTVRYYSLFENDASYSGMARIYRNYLIEEKSMQQKCEDDSSLYLKFFCDLEVKKNFLGIKYYKNIPLTTFDELQNIISEFKSQGIDNLNIQLVGWTNNGVFNRKYVKNAKPLNKLGGKKAFASLLDYAEDNNVNLFPDVDFMTFEKSGNGVSVSKNSAKAVNGEDAKQYNYSIVTYNKNLNINPWYLMSPNDLLNKSKNFLKNYKKLNCKNISLSSSGNMLFSDFKKEGGIFRSESVNTIGSLFEDIESDYKICVEEANAYCLPYVSNITSVPMHSSGYEFFDYDVPFYQIVIHGCISYSSTPAVQYSDYKSLLLKCLETGSDMLFEGIAKESHYLRETRLSDKYSIGFNSWKEQAIKSYGEYSKILNRVKGCTIRSHNRLSDNVYVIEYSNGIKIYVNYSDKDVVLDGIQILSNDYNIKEAKQ